MLLTSATGAAVGAAVSTATLRAADAPLSFPAASVTVVVKSWVPSERLVAVTLQAPFWSAVVWATSVPLSNTRTVAPASAVPLSATLCAAGCRGDCRTIGAPHLRNRRSGRRRRIHCDLATG